MIWLAFLLGVIHTLLGMLYQNYGPMYGVR